MSNLVLKKQNDIISFDREKLDLIKKTVADGLSDLQFELLIARSKATGLDPLQNQIHGVVRQGKLTIQTGIDGFRLIAHRTGHYAGKDEAIFEIEKDGLPLSCKVTVYKHVNGEKVKYTESARWSEYYPGDKQGFMWKKMPFTMLEKCAEAKALRSAFPSDLSGLYAEEEMHQADSVLTTRVVSDTTKEIQDEHIVTVDKVISAFASLGVTKDEICSSHFIDDIYNLTESMIDNLREIHANIKSGKLKKSDVFVKE